MLHGQHSSEGLYANLPSASTSAANTPAAVEDREIVFTVSPLSRVRCTVSEKYEEEKKEEKTEDEEKERDLESGQQTPDYLPELDFGVEDKRPLSKARQILLGATMMSTTIVASATTSSSLLLIPQAAADLGVSELQVQWISSAYSLSYGCGMLVSGRLADLFGRKMLYLTGMCTFLIFNVISGAIRNYIGICVTRAFAGLGVAIALPAAFGILGVNFKTEPSRTIAFAGLALGYPVGGGPGQLIAGVISTVSDRSWQYTFFVLAGFALFPILGALFVIPPEPPKVVTDRKVDWVGALLITGGLSVFSFSLTQSGLATNGWKTPYIPITFVLSLLLIVAYGFWEHYVDKKTSIPPLSHLGIFSRKGWKVTSVLVVTFFAYLSISGWLYLSTIWFQNLKGDSALMNAVHVLPSIVVGTMACIIVPLVAPKIRAPYLLAFGGFTTGTASLIYAVSPENTSYWIAGFLPCVVAPFGADFTVGIGSVLMSNLVDPEDQSLGGALFQTALQIASTVGVCICSLMQTELTDKTSLLEGLEGAFWMMAAFSWAASVIAIITLRKVGLAMDVGLIE